jgi:hypothetical protein
MTILWTIINPPHSLGGSHCGNNSGDMVMIITVITVMTCDYGNSSYVGGGCNANLQQKHVLVQHGSESKHISVQCIPMCKKCTWYLLNTILRQTQKSFVQWKTIQPRQHSVITSLQVWSARDLGFSTCRDRDFSFSAAFSLALALFFVTFHVLSC